MQPRPRRAARRSRISAVRDPPTWHGRPQTSRPTTTPILNNGSSSRNNGSVRSRPICQVCGEFGCDVGWRVVFTEAEVDLSDGKFQKQPRMQSPHCLTTNGPESVLLPPNEAVDTYERVLVRATSSTRWRTPWLARRPS